MWKIVRTIERSILKNYKIENSEDQQAIIIQIVIIASLSSTIIVGLLRWERLLQLNIDTVFWLTGIISQLIAAILVKKNYVRIASFSLTLFYWLALTVFLFF